MKKVLGRLKRAKIDLGLEIQATKPDYIVYAPKRMVGDDTGNEHFLVFTGPGDTLMAVWTQSRAEGSARLDWGASCHYSRDLSPPTRAAARARGLSGEDPHGPSIVHAGQRPRDPTLRSSRRRADVPTRESDGAAPPVHGRARDPGGASLFSFAAGARRDRGVPLLRRAPREGPGAGPDQRHTRRR